MSLLRTFVNSKGYSGYSKLAITLKCPPAGGQGAPCRAENPAQTQEGRAPDRFSCPYSFAASFACFVPCAWSFVARTCKA